MRILFILFFLLLLQLSFAQSAGELERQFTELQMQIETGQIRLDSLKALLEKQAARIEAEKSKTTVDRNKVTKLMAEGIPLTDEIAGSQEQLSLLQQEQAQTRYLLAQRYSAMLDSLKTLENSHSGDADEIRKQIVYYTEKYLLFSPVFNGGFAAPGDFSELSPKCPDGYQQALNRDQKEPGGIGSDNPAGTKNPGIFRGSSR
jgi:hypothetical protein